MVYVLLDCGHRRCLPVGSLEPLKSTGKPPEMIYCEVCGGNHSYEVEGGEKMSDEEEKQATRIKQVEDELRMVNTVVYGLSHEKATDDDLRDAITELLKNDMILTGLRKETRDAIASYAHTLQMRSMS